MTQPPAPSPLRILLLSKTAGYRHESIPAGIQALQALAQTHSWTIDATEDASTLTAANLSLYDVVLFLHTTGPFLDGPQLAALRTHVEDAGAGFVGIHGAAAAAELGDWYAEELIGAGFAGHPVPQKGVVQVEDGGHVITKDLPERWEWFDEWYNFTTNPRGMVSVLMTIDERGYEGGTLGEDHPLVWCREVGKGRSFYTSLGHFDEAWDDERFVGHVVRGIRWAARQEV